MTYLGYENTAQIIGQILTEITEGFMRGDFHSGMMGGVQYGSLGSRAWITCDDGSRLYYIPPRSGA